MPVIGLNFTAINASIDEKKVEGNIDVNSTPHILNIKRKEINVQGMKDVLSVEFKFVTRYEPKIGEVSISGEVLYQTDEAKKIMSMWKDKKLEAKLTVDAFNAIFKKCITKVIQLTDDLRLPPPLTFPVVRTEEEAKKQEQASKQAEKKAAAS